MGLYINNSKVRISLNTGLYCVNIHSSQDPIASGTALKSSDDYALQDIDKLYLRAEGEKQ